MQTVIIVIHLMVVVALVAVVLVQRSEGGALGIGGGGNFMASRGTGNVLTRSTAILAAAFFATSVLLTLLARGTVNPGSILDANPGIETPATPIAPGGGILNQLPGRIPSPAATPAPAETPLAPPNELAPPAVLTPPAATTPILPGFGIPLAPAPTLPGLPGLVPNAPAEPPAPVPLFPLLNPVPTPAPNP